MHEVSFSLLAIMWNDTSYVRSGAFVCAIEENALQAQHRFHAHLTRAWCRSEVGACVWNIYQMYS